MSGKQNRKLIVEWAPFTLADGVDEAALLAASAALQTEFVNKQSGFIRRDLVNLKENQWADIVYWNSLEEAEQAAKNAANSPVCFRYFQLMVNEDPNDPSAGVAHFGVMQTYHS